MTKEIKLTKQEMKERAANGLIDLNIVKTFGCRAPEKATIQGYKDPCQLTPKFDPDFYMDLDILKDAMAWWNCRGQKEGLALYGPTGSGKTSLVRQICAMTGHGLVQVRGHERLEEPDLNLTMIVKNGQTMPIPGPVPDAMANGHVLLIDEVDAINPATNIALHEIAQGKPLHILETGQVIHPAPGFRLVVTCNTNGTGDMGGLFQGTLQQSQAFNERFFWVKVDYLPEEEEIKLIKKIFPDEMDEMIQVYVDFANMVRKAYTGDAEIMYGKNQSKSVNNIEVTFSTRALVRWIEYTRYFMDMVDDGDNAVYYALKRSLTNRATPTTATAIELALQHVVEGA